MVRIVRSDNPEPAPGFDPMSQVQREKNELIVDGFCGEGEGGGGGAGIGIGSSTRAARRLRR